MAERPLKIGLNLLGLPTLDQGGAGMVAGLEAEELARRSEVKLHVVAGEQVCSELRGRPAAVTRSRGASPIRGLLAKALQLRSPMDYMSDVAPTGAFTGCDLVHYPLSFMAAPRHEGATVVTCVDLQHVYHPKFFSARDRALRKVRWDRSAKRATRVAVSSDFVRRSIVERLDIPDERIDVVGACCNPRFSRPAARVHEVNSDYLLYPASPLPAKNHRRLLEAFSQLGREHAGVRLLLVGPATHDWLPVHELIGALGLEERVEVRGHVPLEELVDLYAEARALVFPSLFEGFGIPVLEAMTVGCPVAASDVASIPEICGKAAVLFEPASIESILAGLERVLGLAEADRSELIEAARRRSRAFGLQAMVDRQLDSFRRAADTICR